MKVIIFGATGMVGQGVLRASLLDARVESILAIVRRAGELAPNPKLREVVHADFTDFTTLADTMTGYDACFFCLGISSLGMKEDAYRRITFDFTMAAARVLAVRNPAMTFIYVSGAGTDSTEKGRSMWARVKGQTENALLALPFKAYMFRPGYIHPTHGVVSKTLLYRAAYVIATPLYPVFKALAPRSVTTNEAVGKAMLAVAGQGAPKTLLENADINALAAPSG